MEKSKRTDKSMIMEEKIISMLPIGRSETPGTGTSAYGEVSQEDLATLTYGVSPRGRNRKRNHVPADDSGEKKKRWTLTKLNAVHHEILRLKLAGLKSKDIAKILGVSKPVIKYTVSSSLGKQKLLLMEQARDAESIDFTKDMKALLPRIGQLFEETIDDDEVDLKLRINVATTVAEKFAGAAVPKTINARHIHAHLTAEEIEEIKQRGIEQAAAAGIISED